MDVSKITDKVLGDLQDKLRWRDYKARANAYPRRTARPSRRWSGT